MAKHADTAGELMESGVRGGVSADADADADADAGHDSDAETSGQVEHPEGPLSDEPQSAARRKGRWLANCSVQQQALAAGLAVLVLLTGLTGWLGFRTFEATRSEKARDLMLEVGRQAAVNLTTIDFAEADKDVQRVLDSATGRFHDDFQMRSASFVGLVKKTKSKSVGEVTAAGLEHVTDEAAQVLVAVTVQTSNSAAAEQKPRHWRMRVSVQKLGDQAKVSDVEFVP